MDIGKPTQLPTSGFNVGFEEFVDDSIEVHQAGIFPQIILRFSKEHVYLTITPSDGNFPRFSKGSHDVYLVEKFYSSKVRGLRAYELRGVDRPSNVGALGGNG